MRAFQSCHRVWHYLWDFRVSGQNMPKHTHFTLISELTSRVHQGGYGESKSRVCSLWQQKWGHKDWYCLLSHIRGQWWGIFPKGESFMPYGFSCGSLGYCFWHTCKFCNISFTFLYNPLCCPRKVEMTKLKLQTSLYECCWGRTGSANIVSARLGVWVLLVAVSSRLGVKIQFRPDWELDYC